jgi:leucyl aminopeptidase (aminopeptidase T)
MYTPAPHILDNYATILVNFALNSGAGVKAGEVVQIRIPETAKLLLKPLVKAVMHAGAHAVVDYLPEDGYDKMFFETANDEQLVWYADAIQKAKIESCDHSIAIF